LIPNINTNQHKEPDNFASNWMNSIGDIIELCLSSEIWKRQDVHPDEVVYMTQSRKQTEDRVSKTIFYLNDEPVMMFSKALGDTEVPMHYTLFI